MTDAVANGQETKGYQIPDTVSQAEIPLSAIRENPAALRGVDKDNPEYMLLVESIKLVGVQQPVLVRKQIDPETKEVFYGLIDGLHRYSASQDAGKTMIPVRVIDSADDLKALELQIILNARKVETQPVQYTKAIQRLMAAHPTMTIAQLATEKLAASPQWVSERLGLLKLSPAIQKLVDDGKIGLANAYALAKLKEHDEQTNFVERAMTMTPAEFSPTVQARVKEIRDAKQRGQAPRPEGFVPSPHLQKLGDLKSEFEQPNVGPFLRKELAPNAGPDFDAGFKMGLAWVLHMDPKSVLVQEEKWKQDKARKELDKQAKEKEKAEKRLEAAQKAARDAQEVLKQSQVVTV